MGISSSFDQREKAGENPNFSSVKYASTRLGKLVMDATSSFNILVVTYTDQCLVRSILKFIAESLSTRHQFFEHIMLSFSSTIDRES
jgi:hypothetical protein